MVAQAGGYFLVPFKGHHGVTQGDPLSPNIFNGVSKVVLHNFISVAIKEEAGPKGFGQAVQRLSAYLYAENSILFSM